eukprot:2474770-Rhodomonas_salina.1
MSGTGGAYAPTLRAPRLLDDARYRPGTDVAYAAVLLVRARRRGAVLRYRWSYYAGACGTEIAYAPTRYAVLRYRMLLQYAYSVWSYDACGTEIAYGPTVRAVLR